ncbi:photosynthetic complex assembly protein [Erythrobacter sp. SCSIO 43205]|uniref:photosynthetic complex assembly protein PuhC n=1 Tax=Erythrobacter sp. SCSIO 43205 TaxID=2779361 RepID=UPI001CA83BA5|nr:photosynthetic complex assembly protein PuhC [Erythrobacter sp. SCSIO 43205]UAB78021.1 photosynthetic complex assembly protein [Erythrobacter sp. SCSIO 43205]
MIVREYEKEEITVHRVPIMLMGGIITISLALTTAVTLGFFERQAIPSEAREQAGTQMTASRSLYFYDEADGSVRVEDAQSGEEIARFGVGTGGFVRTSVRGFAYQRRVNGIGREVPFELIAWDNGMLTLLDPTTQKSVELHSFGEGNRQTFANFLIKEPG